MPLAFITCENDHFSGDRIVGQGPAVATAYQWQLPFEARIGQSAGLAEGIAIHPRRDRNRTIVDRLAGRFRVGLFACLFLTRLPLQIGPLRPGDYLPPR